MSYFITDEYIHAKDMERLCILEKMVDNLKSSDAMMYAPAIRAVIKSIKGQYNDREEEVDLLTKDSTVLRNLMFETVALHAHYAATQENRTALLDLLDMVQKEVHRGLEELTDVY